MSEISITAYTRAAATHEPRVTVRQDPRLADRQVQIMVGDMHLLLSASDAQVLAETISAKVREALAA